MDSLLTKLLDRVSIGDIGDLCILTVLYCVYIHYRVISHMRKEEKEKGLS